MKKVVILVIILAVGISLYIYSRVSSQSEEVIPETATGEVSAFLPKEAVGANAPKSTEELNITGPVTDLSGK